MGRFATVLVFACLLAPGAASAADFERRTVPAGGGVVAPGATFQMVAFEWSGKRAPLIDVRSEGPRGWSQWSEAGTEGVDGPDVVGAVDDNRRGSDPVWTGDARRVQVRLRGKAYGRVIAVFQKIPVVARSASSGGAAPGKITTPKTKTSVDAPAIVPRAQWDPSGRCKPKRKPFYGEVLGTVVHHTESTNSYSAGQARSVVLGICRFHRYSRKWNDIGYNLLIDRFGTVYEGRAGGVDKPVIGAHAQGFNSETAGISLIGGFMSVQPPAATLESLRRVLAWKLELAGLTRNERVPLISAGGGSSRFKTGRVVFARPVSGHRDLNFTDCPGNQLYAKLVAMQDLLTGPPRTATRLSTRMRRVAVATGGQAVQLTGRLTAGGSPAAGQALTMEAFTVRGWEQIATGQTDPAGIYRMSAAPRGRYYMRARFNGTESLRFSRSRDYYSPKLKRAPQN